MTNCSFPGCVKDRLARGYCGAHYRQLRLGETLRPLRGTPQKEALKRDAEGNRCCTMCKRYRPESDYQQKGTKAGLLRSHCNRCNVVRRMGITANEYEAMFEAQGGKCAICRRPPRVRSLAVDHDHSCCPGAGSCGKCIRGLLCDDCNQAIGRFEDDVERLKAAVTYLSR
jgi:hypothetical protein